MSKLDQWDVIAQQIVDENEHELNPMYVPDGLKEDIAKELRKTASGQNIFTQRELAIIANMLNASTGTEQEVTANICAVMNKISRRIAGLDGQTWREFDATHEKIVVAFEAIP